jgi:acetylornithine deacetylase
MLIYVIRVKNKNKWKHQNPYTRSHFTFRSTNRDSFLSTEEDKTALLLERFNQNEIPFKRENNNVWAFNMYFDKDKPTLLLNSHDTVRPNQAY